MAAAASTLSRELECAICSDQLKQPKFIGPCNHTFCKHCIDQLWESHGRRRTVPCPQCREDCPIPSSGGHGLKDNFLVANIIEIYDNQLERLSSANNCTQCPNRALSLCTECDLKMCPKCIVQHDRNPDTSAHDLFGLCSTHGNGVLFFCSPCKQAVCSSCRISDHGQGNHHVIPIRPVFVDLMSAILASSAELEDAIRTQVGKQETKLSHLRDIVQQQTSISAKFQATAIAKRTIVGITKEIDGLRTESRSIQRQIDILVKKKKALDDRTNQLVEDVHTVEKQETKVIAEIEERFARSYEEIDVRLRSLDTRRKEMWKTLERGRTVGSIKIIIDTESIANLTSISQEIMDLISASSRKSDTETVIEEVTRSMSELGLDVVDIGQGMALKSGDHQIRRGQTKRVFRLLKKVCNVIFPRDRPCKAVHRLRHLLVPDSRLATLGSSQSDWANTIYFNDDVSSSFTGTITEGVYPARDMAVSSTGELIVARWGRPPIRKFHPATGAYRDIDITHDGEAINKLWNVATDESDNMFVLTSCSNPLLYVVKPNGNVIQCVPLRGDAYNMVFCPLSRILYIAAGDRVLRFHWSNNILKEISSSSHGVVGFCCYDVCIGGGGEVLVAGWMGVGENVIYQVTGEDEEDFEWSEIEYQDGAKRTSFNRPHICINDDHLWLGFEDKLEKFQVL